MKYRKLLGILICIIIIIVGCVFFSKFLISTASDPVYDEIALKIPSADTESEINELIALLSGKNLSETEQIIFSLEKAAIKESTAQERFSIAIFASSLFDKKMISEETAKTVISEMLSSFSPIIITNEFETNAFIKLLDNADSSLTQTLLDLVINKQGYNTSLTSYLGDYFGKKGSPESIISIYNKVNEKETFLNSALNHVSLVVFLNHYSLMQEHAPLLSYVHNQLGVNIGDLISSVSDENLQKTLLISLAPYYELPDDVLSFLHLAGKFNVKPTDCYPNGAKLDWDLTHLNMFKSAENLSENGKFLVISRVEKKEALEFKSVSEDEYTLDSFISLFDDNYESNTIHGKDAFTVIMDTKALEMMPVEIIPTTISELNSILLFDTQYLRDGTICHTDYTYSIGQSPILEQESQITGQKHYPAYSVVQRADIYNLRSGSIEYCFDLNIIDRPEVDTSDNISDLFSNAQSGLLIDYGLLTESSNKNDIEYLYCAIPDEEWIVNTRLEVLSLLEKANWSIFNAELIHYYENLSEE